MTDDSKIIKILQSKNITMDNCEMITPPPKINNKVIKKNKRNSTDEYKIHNDDNVVDKKLNKKYKGEMKRNFVEEYHDNSHDNMRKQVWPSFKNKKQSKNHENNKAKNQPISPNGEICYKKKSCFKKNDKHDDKILNDNIDNWQFKRAQDRHIQREENDVQSNFGWYHDRAKSRENSRQKY